MSLHISKGNGAPSIAPVEIGQHYIDEQNGVHYLSVGNSSVDDWVQVAEGGGATNFLQLLDTPSSYAGQANKTVRVNGSANGLEFVNQLFVELFDTPSSYSGFGSFIVRVKPDETGVEFVPSSAGSLPPGGTAGQLLIKIDAIDDNATWQDLDAQPAITAIDGRITTNEGNINTNATNISSNDTDIATNATNISTNQSDIAANKTDITNLQNDKEDKANKGIALGYAPLGADTRVPKLNLPLDIQYTDQKSQASGYASLDTGARVPKAELPADTIYQADLNAETIPRKWIYYVDQDNGADTLDTGRGNIDRPFATIKAACDFVATLGTGSGFSVTIQVANGNYLEQPFVIPNFVSLVGTPDFNTAIVPAVDSTDPLVTIGVFSNINNINFNGSVGGVGASYSGTAIFAPGIFGCSIINLLINFWTTGINVAGTGGTGARADVVLSNIGCGQFGPVTNPIIIANGVTVESTSMFFFSNSVASVDISGGSKILMDACIVGGGQTAFKVADATLQVSDAVIEQVDTIVETSGVSTVIIGNAAVIGNDVNEGFKLSGVGGLVQISDMTAIGFTNIVHTFNSTQNIYFNACQFNTEIAGGKALLIEGNVNFQVKNCSFIGRTLDNTTAIEVGNFQVDYPFVDINDSFFFNYQDAILSQTGQSTIRHSTFEVFAGPLAGTTGITANNDSVLFIEQCNLIAGIGVTSRGTAQCRLSGVRFFNTDTDFIQEGSGIIFTTQSVFDEDKVQAETWGAVTGNYNSTKTGDRGLIVTDKLKVGVPELGRQTGLGEGTSYTRGMLVYTYDPATDTYTDVTADAQDIGSGTSVGIPNIIPNSALYIGCELVDSNALSLLFVGLNVTVDNAGDEGTGSVITELWNGTSWQAIRQMATEAEPPFRQVNQGTLVSDTAYNLRFPNTVQNDWERTDPIVPPLGKQLYWIRARVASDWLDNAWQFRRPFTVPAGSVSAVLQNFPVYVDLATMPASFWTNVNTDGSDIRVTDKTGVNLVAMQLVDIDTIGQTGQLVFSAAELNNAVDNEFYIYYGNPLADPLDPLGQYGRVQVWREYDAVYHLEDGTATWEDATINNYQAISEGTVNAQAGKFGNAIQTTNQPVDCLTLPENDTLNDPGNVLTYECWFTKNDTTKRRAVDLANNQTQTNRDSHFGIWANDQIGFDYNSAPRYNAGVSVADGAWHHALLTLDGSQLRGYVDGVQVFSQNHSAVVQSSNFPVRIANRGNLTGTFQWGPNSLIDNVRIARKARTSQWVATQYFNQNDPAGFYVIGNEETELSQQLASDPINNPATYKQIKLWPNCIVLNADGYLEFFGKSRPIFSLPTTLKQLESTAGTNAPIAAQDIWYTKEFGITSMFRFPDSLVTRATSVSTVNERIDTSSSVTLRIHYVPRGTGAGNILFRATFATSGGETTFYTNPDDAPQLAPDQDNEYVLKNVSADQNNKDEFVDIVFELPILRDRNNFSSRDDLLWFTIERVGSSQLDTYQGPIDFVALAVFVVGWCSGQHTLFL